MDPTTARTEGNESFKQTIIPRILFENCSERQAKDQATDLKCRDQHLVSEWVRDVNPTLLLVYAFNFVNLDDPNQPFHTKISSQMIGEFDNQQSQKYDIPLKLHQLDLVDDIIDPF